MQGKITLPVAKAMSRLPQERARVAVGHAASQAAGPKSVQSIVAKLEAGCGAIEACAVQARTLVEEGWTRLDADDRRLAEQDAAARVRLVRARAPLLVGPRAAGRRHHVAFDG